MVFFATYAIGNVILPPYADRFGRKKLFVCSLFVCLASYIVILSLPYKQWSVYTIIGVFAIGGFNSAARMMVGYCFLMEFAPKSHASWMSTLWNIHDCVTVVFTILFYRYWNKDWHYTLYWCSFIQIVSIFNIITFIPESPKWLYDKKKYGELYEVMTYMAKRNGVKMKSAEIIKYYS